MADAKHDDDQLYPAPGPSYTFRIVGTSNYPIQEVKYQVDLYDSTIFMVYQNAAFDLVALVIAKLGQVFAEYEITGDIGRAQAGIASMTKALNDVKP